MNKTHSEKHIAETVSNGGMTYEEYVADEVFISELGKSPRELEK